jgi:hypothetical protein
MVGSAVVPTTPCYAKPLRATLSEYYDEQQRKDVFGLDVDHNKRPEKKATSWAWPQAVPFAWRAVDCSAGKVELFREQAAARRRGANPVCYRGGRTQRTHLDVSHVAATPVGLRVTATAAVLGVEGRIITFQVQARDEVEVIGTGTHQRVVVSVARFDERIQRKVLSL